MFLTVKKSGFFWKLVVVYGSPYEEGKQRFLDELEVVMSSWVGPVLVGGDINLVRAAADKSNGRVNFRWTEAFNAWISKWALIELDPHNRLYTWTNNQEILVLDRIDRIFIIIDLDDAFL